MTTPTYALRLICDEELRTAVRSGARRRQATDVTRSLCFEQLFPTPPATRASCEIYNDCSAVLAYVLTTVEPSRCAACYSCNVWVSPLGYGIVYVSDGSIVLPNRNYFSRFRPFLSPDGDSSFPETWDISTKLYHVQRCVVGLLPGRSGFDPSPVG